LKKQNKRNLKQSDVFKQAFLQAVLDPCLKRWLGGKLWWKWEGSMPKFTAPGGVNASRCFEELAAASQKGSGGWMGVFVVCAELGQDIQKAWVDFWALYKRVYSPQWVEDPAVLTKLEQDLSKWSINLALPRRGATLTGKRPKSVFPRSVHAEYIHIFPFHSVHHLRLHKELHSFTTETMEGNNQKHQKKFFASSKRQATEVDEIAYADLRSVLNPASITPLSHFKLCPLRHLCSHEPFAYYGDILNHLESAHALVCPNETAAEGLLGTREECMAKWASFAQDEAPRLRQWYGQTLFFQAGFPSDGVNIGHGGTREGAGRRAAPAAAAAVDGRVPKRARTRAPAVAPVLAQAVAVTPGANVPNFVTPGAPYMYSGPFMPTPGHPIATPK
jgi:hypothetical protein